MANGSSTGKSIRLHMDRNGLTFDGPGWMVSKIRELSWDPRTAKIEFFDSEPDEPYGRMIGERGVVWEVYDARGVPAEQLADPDAVVGTKIAVTNTHMEAHAFLSMARHLAPEEASRHEFYIYGPIVLEPKIQKEGPEKILGPPPNPASGRIRDLIGGDPRLFDPDWGMRQFGESDKAQQEDSDVGASESERPAG